MEARQGLWWALKGLDIGPGDEILAPAYHHGSEIEVLVRTGARCRFYDSRETFEPDESELESLLGPRVRGLYLIHQLGFAQNAGYWRRWCDERGLLLFEDGAQAWLSARDGQPVGAHADLALFCLYKVFGVTDGGAVLSKAFAGPLPTRNSIGARGLAGRFADWAAQRSRLAAALFRKRRYPPAANERPEVDFALSGLDERATRTTRALLSRAVDTSAPARRRANFARLADRFGELRSPVFATMPPESSPLAFPIEVEDKRVAVDRLASRGIMGTLMWTTPHPALSADSYPGAANLRGHLVGLPVHQELDAADMDRIADMVAAVLAECRA